jgi:autotransporter-associated beta strand protein
MLILGEPAALGSDATWSLNPTSNDWSNPLNWTPNTVPGVGDTASFGGSDITDIAFSQTVSVDEILFNPGGATFTFTVSHFDGLFFDSDLGIVNNSGVTQNFVSAVDENDKAGVVSFSDHSNAGSQTAFSIGARQTSSGARGAAQFLEFGSADHGTFVNQATPIADPMGAQSVFFSSSTAASGVFINEGAVVNGAGGGATIFYNQTNAGAATLIARGGSNGGGGGQIKFFDSSKGGTARVEVFGNGFLDVSDHGAITLGSIEGDGLILLAQSKLTAGGNGLSTVFSGIMKEGGASGGSFAKAGAGTLTLSGASLYTGGTIVSAGTLVVANATGSATGTGAVSVTAGTLGGSGIIAGAVTIGTGAGAFLAPAHGGNKQLTLTIQGSLTFNSDATYTYTFKAKGNRSKVDKVIANGVTINAGATFNLSGIAQGTLTQGTVLTAIKNTAATPVSGTFSNLPDGAIVTVNGNKFQAGYQGGDGNDLTLTVVP